MYNMCIRNKNKKGFTLVELVVVIAIIGVLAAIIIPSVIMYVRKSRQAAANEDARNIFANLASFATELHFKDDTASVANGIYYYGAAVSGASHSDVLSEQIKSAAGSIDENTCILVKFTNGHFPKIIVSNGGVNDTYYGSYPEPLNGKQEKYSTGAINHLS